MLATEPDDLDHDDDKGGNFGYFVEENKNNNSARPLSYQKSATQANNFQKS